MNSVSLEEITQIQTSKTLEFLTNEFKDTAAYLVKSSLIL